MTNKMRLVFVIVATVTGVFFVLMSTQFSVDVADQALSSVGNSLGLHEAPALSALAILLIPCLYMYLVFSEKGRHS
jgi:hypothetical protein